MQGLNFLNNVVLEEVKSTRTSSSKINRQPTNGADIRLFHNGAMYPSQALIEEFHLEYLGKDVEADENGNIPNGLDFIDSRQWGNYQITDKDQQLVFVAAVPKKLPKVDAFGSCKYDNGVPTGSVGEQGSATYGKTLLKLLNAIYGVDTPTIVAGQEEPVIAKCVELTEGKYIDLSIARDFVMSHPSNRYHFPKLISRGEKAGTSSVVVRENCVINPIVLFKEESDVDTTAESEAKVQDVAVAETVISADEPQAIGDYSAPVVEEEQAPVVAPVVEETPIVPVINGSLVEEPIVEAPVILPNLG